MLKSLKRLLTALIAGASIQPAARSAAVPDSKQVTADENMMRIYEAVEADDNYVSLSAVRPEVLARYDGPRTPVTPELLAQIRASKQWRNSCITAREETREFIAARMR